MSAKLEKDSPLPTPDLIEDKFIEVKETISEFVKANPLASVALAAGIGFLIARLLSGRKD